MKRCSIGILIGAILAFGLFLGAATAGRCQIPETVTIAGVPSSITLGQSISGTASVPDAGVPLLVTPSDAKPADTGTTLVSFSFTPTDPGTFTVTAGCTGLSYSGSAGVSLTVIPVVSLSAANSSILAGGGTESVATTTITATVTDINGTAVPGVSVSFSATNGGSISGASGTTAALTSGDVVGPSTITASCDGGIGTTSVGFVAPVGSISYGSWTDSAGTYTMTVTGAVTYGGSPVTWHSISFAASGSGASIGSATLSGGAYSATLTFTPPSGWNGKPITLSASLHDGSISAS